MLVYGVCVCPDHAVDIYQITVVCFLSSEYAFQEECKCFKQLLDEVPSGGSLLFVLFDIWILWER